MSNYTEKQLVSLLKKASDAYYNKEKPILSDLEYDNLRDELESRFPSNPFLQQIGAPVQKGAIALPYKMASLNKIKPGTGQVQIFASAGKSWVLSEKLDGISVLWDSTKQKLYLRGDGLMGVDISAFAPHIPSLIKGKPIVCRGELLVKTADVPEGTLGRSWVNGLVHQKQLKMDDISKLVFMAYEVLVPEHLSAEQQFQLLQQQGFQVPWWQTSSSINDSSLEQVYKTQRTTAPYSIDGIVVAQNIAVAIDTKSTTVSNPKHKVAFKMTLDDQQATTTVVDILWSASHQGYWIPRIQIQPVVIGGSNIEFLTGHHAKFILQHELGKGAKIIVRKSGDVIPTLEKVLSIGEKVILPRGTWDGTETHYKVLETNSEMEAKKLEHFASTLDIPHLGPGLVAKLLQNGKKTVYDLVSIEKEDLDVIVGKGMSAKIFPAMQRCLQEASECSLMVASSKMPRGIGDTKLKAFFAVKPDIRTWLNQPLVIPSGWSEDSVRMFLNELPQYIAWRKEQLPMIPFPILPKQELKATVCNSNKQRICFTGFRDSSWEKSLEEKGHEIVSGVSSKTTLLVVKELSSSEKVKKANDLGIRILTREEFKREFIDQ